ncbi:hypothetical protein V8G54_008508 [Vigna mungo]|uniref:Uncharacterized protein n=1 Tax=Vigna mungo TaxID=3915 RepID=A0AAQ3P5C6_VIGMU
MSETFIPFYPLARGKISTQISSLFYRPSRTKRLISSTAYHRRRDSLFYPLARGKVTTNSLVPSTAPLGRRDSSLPLSLKDEEIHLFTLPQEERQHLIFGLFHRPSRTNLPYRKRKGDHLSTPSKEDR